jgi:hypothetical protein
MTVLLASLTLAVGVIAVVVVVVVVGVMMMMTSWRIIGSQMEQMNSVC